MARVVIALTLILYVWVFPSFTKEWQGIVPCSSTRVDVERTFGKDSFGEPEGYGAYKYKGLRVTVDYYRAIEGHPDRDIVQRIRVYTENAQRLSQYARNIKNFSKNFLKTEVGLNDPHLALSGYAVYRNWNDGFEIWVQKPGGGPEIIDSFGYFDPVWDCAKRTGAPR